MFSLKLILLYLATYGLLYITGWGLTVYITKGKNSSFRFLLSPIIGTLSLMTIPMYFSAIGINTFDSAWFTLISLGLLSAYSLVKHSKNNIQKINLTLIPIIAISSIPSFIILLKAGFLTSTMTSYSCFVTIPANYLIHHSMHDNILINYNKPITNCLFQIVSNKEYFGPFFLLAAVSSIFHITPDKLYLSLSSIIASFLPISIFIASRLAFKLEDKLALLASFLVTINYSYLVWPVIGQMPMSAGIVFLTLAIAFMPAMVTCRKAIDYVLYSALLAGIVASYSILMPYLIGALGLYLLCCKGSLPANSHLFKNAGKLALGTLLIDPFCFLFWGLHGAQLLTITSQYTKNIPRYPQLEGLLGFHPDFSTLHAGHFMNDLALLVAMSVVVLAVIGYYHSFRSRNYIIFSALTFITLLGSFFYLIDFRYHFYKNAIIGIEIFTCSALIGGTWIYQTYRFRTLRALIIAILCFITAFNIQTLLIFCRANHPIISKSIMDLQHLSKFIPTNSHILASSHNPTEEAWFSYFLRKNNIKLNGSLEPWGFWILSPFTGKPNTHFFYTPDKDHIDYTLSAFSQNQTDIVQSKHGKTVWANTHYRLTQGVPSPDLLRGWYALEGAPDWPFRWTDRESSLVFAKPAVDSVLELRGTVPAVYQRPLQISIYLNKELIDRFQSGPTTFIKHYLLKAKNLKSPYNLLTFKLNNCFWPDRSGHSSDQRRLGMMLNSLTIVPLTTLQPGNGINIGTAKADKFLVSGWSINETAANKMTFRWVEGTKASLVFSLARVAQQKMELRVHPFRYPGSPPQMMHIVLNHHPINTFNLGEGWQTYTAVIPARFLTTGINTLHFTFDYCASPAAVLKGSHDLRELSAAFDYIKFLSIPATAPK